MSDDVVPHAAVLAAISLFTAIVALIAADLIVDYQEGGSLFHLGTELGVLLAAACGVALLLMQLRRSRSDLVRVRRRAEQWREENQQLLAGLGWAIDRQFQRWGLTPAESEVGLLLLKGLSHKEIANARQTSERTIREQARSLYRKAGLTGRASLSAFFLEDLLLPRGQSPEPGSAP